MAKRLTDLDKWKDSWFLDLSLDSKVIFLYLCDRCDIAGFYERHDKTINYYTGIEINKIDTCLKELEKSILLKDSIIWVKNFIRHQKNIPLNPFNNCHKAILRLLVYRMNLFGDLYESVLGIPLKRIRSLEGAKKGLVSPTGKGIGKGKGKNVCIKEGIVKGGITYPPSVILSEQQYKYLTETYGITITKKYIEDLNIFSEKNPKAFKIYASHKAVIESWMRRDGVKKLPPIDNKPKEELKHDPNVAELIHKTVRGMI